MKKTLVAMASMAALGAFAQSAVTMYGIVEATVDLGYRNTTDTRTDTVVGNVLTRGVTSSTSSKPGFRLQDGNDQGQGTSRIGWRGTEDLGGGMKGNFQLEMGLRVDDGCVTTGANNVCSSGNTGGNIFGRNAWVGASGDFGEVRLGRQVLGSFSTQAGGWSAGSSNGLYDAGATTAPLMGGVRFSNAIRYITPNMSGLTASVMLAAPEIDNSSNNGVAGAGNVTTSTKNKTGFDLALDYANGPLYLGFGYNKGQGVTTSNEFILNTRGNTSGKADAYTLSASYDLGMVKPFFNYTRQKTNNFVATPSSFTTTNTPGVEKAFFLGLRAPVGAATLVAGYGNSKLSSVATTVVVNGNIGSTATTTTTGKENAFQIGLQYPLSKRTMVEANFGQYKNSSNAVSRANVANVANNDSFTTYTVNKISALNFGLRHTF